MRGRKCSSTLPDGMEGDFIETEWNLFKRIWRDFS